MRTHLTGLVVALGTLGWAAASHAQAAPAAESARRGFYASIGFGYANASGIVDLDGATASLTNSEVGYYAGLGGTLNGHWRIGFEADGWTNLQQDSIELCQFNNVMFTFYPSITRGLWFKGGLGYVIEADTFAGTYFTTGGFGGGLGAGYDWLPRNGTFAVIPYVNYMYQFTPGHAPPALGWTLKSNVLQVGIGIGYQH